MPNLTLPVSRGVVDGKDASLIDFTQGELQTGEGVVYEPGDPAAHKISGRTVYQQTSTTDLKPVLGIKFVQFDATEDKLCWFMNLVSAPNTLIMLTGKVADSNSTVSTIHNAISLSATVFDVTKFTDNAVFVDGNSEPWVMKNDNTVIKLGLNPVTATPTGAVQAPIATGLTADYQYWITEYDSTNDVESAFNGTVYSASPVAQDVKITYPVTFVNSSGINVNADTFRLYRTKAGGSFPIGWLIDTTISGGDTYIDFTADDTLVTAAAYKTVTINGASESRDREPTTFSSIAAYKGGLVGVKGRSYYWSVAGSPHSWPVSYTNAMRPLYGGQGRCIREVNRVALLFFDNETFRLNYLPNGADSYFDPGVAQERISTHGTPSSNGAVVFSPDGYPDMIFFASRAGPMVTDGNATARAVLSIAWDTHVSLANLNQCVCINNTDKYRVEMYYPTSDTTIWRCLHFYYDDMRLRQGRLPKLSWTGPHIVPGPGTYAVLNGSGRIYTCAKKSLSTVYYENGASDAANLVDTNGTVNFKLRTGKMYTAGIGNEATLRRTYISKRTAGSGTYSTTHTAYREEAGSTQNTLLISATNAGLSSLEFNASGQAHDLLVERNDATAMPAINNLTAEITDISGFEKTTK